MKPLCVTIQMKAIEQCFHVVLLFTLHKVVLSLKSVDYSLVCLTIQMKAIEQYLCGTTVYFAYKLKVFPTLMSFNRQTLKSMIPMLDHWQYLIKTGYYGGLLRGTLCVCFRFKKSAKRNRRTLS